MDKPFTIYAETDDPEFVADFKAQLEREQRTMRVVVLNAVRDYIARSKAEARAAKAASRTPQVSA